MQFFTIIPISTKVKNIFETLWIFNRIMDTVKKITLLYAFRKGRWVMYHVVEKCDKCIYF